MSFRAFSIVIAGCIAAPAMVNRALAGDDLKSGRPSPARQQASGATATKRVDEDPAEVNLLDAMRQGKVSVRATGSNDGRLIVSVHNKSRQPLRVVLPPGIVAQSATGQMGGMMGGMGGGMGGMGGGGMMGGMGGGGGMGGMGRWAAAWADGRWHGRRYGRRRRYHAPYDGPDDALPVDHVLLRRL